MNRKRHRSGYPTAILLAAAVAMGGAAYAIAANDPRSVVEAYERLRLVGDRNGMQRLVANDDLAAFTQGERVLAPWATTLSPTVKKRLAAHVETTTWIERRDSQRAVVRATVITPDLRSAAIAGTLEQLDRLTGREWDDTLNELEVKLHDAEAPVVARHRKFDLVRDRWRWRIVTAAGALDEAAPTEP